MTTSALGTVVIVIVVAAGLAVWITAVFRAERHPEPGEPGRCPAPQDHRRHIPRRPAPADATP